MTQFIKGTVLQLDDVVLPATGIDGDLRYSTASNELVRYSAANAAWERVNAGEILKGNTLQLASAALPLAGQNGEVRLDSASNTLKVYSTAVSSWLDLGAGGGGGGSLNFIDDTVGFADSANITSEVTNLATEILGEGTTYKATTTGSTTTSDLIKMPFSIKAGYEGLLTNLKFFFGADATYSDDDFEAVIIHDPAGLNAPVSQNVSLIKDTRIFKTPFMSIDDKTKLDYELQIKVKTGAKAMVNFIGTLKADVGSGVDANIIVTSKLNAPSGGWFPTITNASVVVNEIRENNRVKLQYKISRVASSAVFTSFQVKLPYVLSNSNNILNNNNTAIGSGNYSRVGSFDKLIRAVYRTGDLILVRQVDELTGATTHIDNTSWNAVGTTSMFFETDWLYPDEYQTTPSGLLDENALYASDYLDADLISTTMPVGGNTSLLSSTVNSEGLTLTSGSLAIRAKGKYKLDLNVRASLGSGTNTIYFFITKNSTTLAGSIALIVLKDTDSSSVSRTVLLDKGDILRLYATPQNGTTASNFNLTNAGQNFFSIVRLPDQNTGAPIGFAEAKGGNFGLVQVEQVTLSADGDLTGTLKISKVGNVITLVMTGAWSHLSLSNAVTSVGFLPLRFRPIAGLYNTYFSGSNLNGRMFVKPDGQIEFQYRQDSGSVVARLNTVVATSFTYGN